MMNNMNNIGMNQMGMNNIRLNQIEMNQMEMNQMGMNQMEMDQMIMNKMDMNKQPNQMNLMNMDLTLNIKNIVEPYENKIKELEEIIRQKDFEITVLKQKLNMSNSNINLMNMNINPMMINQNFNPMMMGNNNQQLENKGQEIDLIIKTKANRVLQIKFFQKDKLSSLIEKYNIKGHLTYNYKVLRQDLTLEENRLSHYSIIHEEDGVNVIFNTSDGKRICLNLSEDCPIGLAIIFFLIQYNPIYLHSLVKGEKSIIFLYNASLLNIRDKTTLVDIFKGNPLHCILVQLIK